MSGLASLRNSQFASSYAMKNASRMWPSLLAPAGSSRKTSWKRLKFGRSGTSFISDLHARLERARAAAGRPAIEPLVDLARQVGQRLDQQRRVAARVVDVGLQQHAVARRLVDLDVEPLRQQPLELRAVEAGAAADERQPRRVERELVVVPRVEQLLPRGVRPAVVVDARRAELRAAPFPRAWRCGSSCEISGCPFTSRRMRNAISAARIVSS